MKTPTALQKVFSRLWRQPGFRRLFYNGLGLAFRGRRDWQMMNCGYLAPQSAPASIPLPPEWKAEHLSYALYAHLVRETPLAGKEILELGAGRGGGARYVHRMYAPRRVVAADYAAQTTRWCRRNFSAPGLDFITADACALPFPDSAFDVLIGVEVTHCLPDKARFFAEAARVLRPGGRLLIADFFYRRPDAMHALGKFEAALAAAPFTIEIDEDLTPGVMAAMETDSVRRIADITRSVPKPLQNVARSFASTTESGTYLGLANGRAVYRRYVLTRTKARAGVAP